MHKSTVAPAFGSFVRVFDRSPLRDILGLAVAMALTSPSKASVNSFEKDLPLRSIRGHFHHPFHHPGRGEVVRHACVHSRATVGKGEYITIEASNEDLGR